jgi:hypothetical protein
MGTYKEKSRFTVKRRKLPLPNDVTPPSEVEGVTEAIPVVASPVTASPSRWKATFRALDRPGAAGLKRTLTLDPLFGSRITVQLDVTCANCTPWDAGGTSDQSFCSYSTALG